MGSEIIGFNAPRSLDFGTDVICRARTSSVFVHKPPPLPFWRIDVLLLARRSSVAFDAGPLLYTKRLGDHRCNCKFFGQVVAESFNSGYFALKLTTRIADGDPDFSRFARGQYGNR